MDPFDVPPLQNAFVFEQSSPNVIDLIRRARSTGQFNLNDVTERQANSMREALQHYTIVPLKSHQMMIQFLKDPDSYTGLELVDEFRLQFLNQISVITKNPAWVTAFESAVQNATQTELTHIVLVYNQLCRLGKKNHLIISKDAVWAMGGYQRVIHLMLGYWFPSDLLQRDLHALESPIPQHTPVVDAALEVVPTSVIFNPDCFLCGQPLGPGPVPRFYKCVHNSTFHLSCYLKMRRPKKKCPMSNCGWSYGPDELHFITPNLLQDVPKQLEDFNSAAIAKSIVID